MTKERRVFEIIETNEGLREIEIAEHIFPSRAPYQQMVNKECRSLVQNRKVIRKGKGGNSDPFRYYLPAAAYDAH